jgi:hypothetical protein
MKNVYGSDSAGHLREAEIKAPASANAANFPHHRKNDR